MFVCMYVCTYFVCVYVCKYIIYIIYTYIYIYVYIYIYIYHPEFTSFIESLHWVTSLFCAPSPSSGHLEGQEEGCGLDPKNTNVTPTVTWG